MRIRRMLVSCLALVMMAGVFLTGCGKEMTPESVAGTYTCTKDLRDYINEGLKESLSSEDGGVDFAFESPINVNLILKLNEDETFELSVDKDGFAEAFGEVFEAEGERFLKAVMKSMGLSEDMISADQLQSFMDQMKQELANSFSSDEMGASQGKYSLKGNKITLTSGDDEKSTGQIDSDGAITLTDKALEEYIGDDSLVFKKDK